MTRLIPKSSDCPIGEVHLASGCTVIGRDHTCQVVLAHDSVSRRHCELWVTAESVLVRDLDSRNGTSVDGAPVSEAQVFDGQSLRIGDLDFLVAGAPARISVPDLHLPETRQQSFLDDGTAVCFRHAAVIALYRCGKCERCFCGACVRELRVAQGTAHRFCPECGGQCERLVPKDAVKKKASWLDRIVDAFTKPPSRRG